MLLGSVVHEILAKSADLEDTALIEERFLIDFMGKKISMKPDHVEHIAGSNPIAYHLKDIKLTSVWSVILDDKFDWKAQTNCYAFGLRKIGINVTKISIECLLKDWSHTDAIKDKDYPQDKNLVIPIEVWPDERCEEYLAGRVKLFTECEKLADTMLPPCTMSERWARPTKYKVMKKGAERSTRNLSSMEDAETYIREKDMQSTHEIVVEKGESIRCERYCAAKQFCNQYNTLINPAF